MRGANPRPQYFCMADQPPVDQSAVHLYIYIELLYDTATCCLYKSIHILIYLVASFEVVIPIYKTKFKEVVFTTEKNFFEQLYNIDVRDRMYQKNGLNYIPWATAWSEVAKVFPDATYEIVKFGDGQLPYTESDLGIMVYTRVTINNITREMCLPVMDGANKAMKSVEYTYSTKFGEKTVAAATMFDINKTIMRCLAKNLAMFGLGLHLWTKEEAPESVIECEKLQKDCMELIKKKSALSEKTKEKVGEICKSLLPEQNGDPRECNDNDVLEDLKKKLTVLRKIV